MRGATCSRPKATGMLSQPPEGPRPPLPNSVLGFRHRFQRVPRTLVELLAVFGQAHCAGRAVKQSCPEMILKGRNDAAHRRLGGVNLTRDRGKTTHFGDTDEHLHRGDEVHELIR